MTDREGERELFFDTKVEEVTIGSGVSFEIIRPVDAYPLLEAFLDEADRGPDPFSTDIWPSARALAAWVIRTKGAQLEGPVLDLGTGLGLTALAIAWAGLDVVATDASPIALQLVACSGRLNGLQERIEVARYRWGEPLARRFGTVVGADLVYQPDSHEALLTTLRAALEGGCSGYLVDPGRKASAAFLPRLEAHFDVVAESLGDGLTLWRIARKGGD